MPQVRCGLHRLTDCTQGGQGLECGHRRFVALVPHLAAGTVQGQFEVLAGQHTEGDRDPGPLCCRADPLGHLVVDVLVVGCLPLDHRSQADDCIVVAGPGELLGDDGNFEGPRYRHDDDSLVGDTVLSQRRDGGFAESVGDVGVVLRNDHGVAVVTELLELRRPEGPFGEFKGLYIEREENHVIEVLGVTARANPYYHALLCGSPEDMRLLELSVATQIFQQLSNTLPGILDVSCVPNIMSTVVQIEQQYEGHARQVMLTVFGVNHDYSKSCIVVDDDVNINDFSDVYWACMMRASAENDISVISGVPGFYRDPDRDHWGRLGIDATKPWSRRKNFERTRVPDAHNIDLSNYLS